MLEHGVEGVNLICRCVGVSSEQQQPKQHVTKNNKKLSCVVCGKEDPKYTKTEHSFCSAKCYFLFKKGMTPATTRAANASESKDGKPKSKVMVASFLGEEARLADRTGSILIRLPTKELRNIVVSGAALIVRNARVLKKKKKNESIWLVVDKWGLVERFDTKWGYSAPDSVQMLKLDDKSNKSLDSAAAGRGGGGRGSKTSPLPSKANEKV
mmetsp:Transcript_23300/g.32582  ORF Transcript_23300/g.32582 Transcript_23300/m.32582 type:complete len:211 (-) Transcript_23300:515-1147(-)